MSSYPVHFNVDLERALYRDADDTITPDVHGHEWFVAPQYSRRPVLKSPLAADFADADTTNWTSEPRPSVTAWEGADFDAHWRDGEVWRHCQTGSVWVAPHSTEQHKAA